jgi:predicted DsbA family dithiol-disulfide isomerase
MAEDMRRHASTLGLDVGRFMIDLDAEQTQQTIDTQKATCMGNGVRGTPSFFINGDLIIGARPYEEFRTLIEDELGDAAE